MSALDTVSLSILLGSALILAGVLSSLVALRFGAPLLLGFLVVGMLAGESGPGGIAFDDVRMTYLVGSIALALILFDGGLRTRYSTIGIVLAPSLVLATVGVVLTAALITPFAFYLLHLGWTESLLVGAVVASTDAAAVFLLIHSRGLRLRPRVGALLEAESGTNDPFAIFLTIVLVEILLTGHYSPLGVALNLATKAIGGVAIGYLGGKAIVYALNRFGLAQGLHAVFVAIGALIVFAVGETVHASGFLAVYLAGLIVGNNPARAHSSIVSFLDAATWLAQIVMFMLLGLLAWPGNLPKIIIPALGIAFALMFIARPIAVFLCLVPFRFSLREKFFVSWVGLRGAVGIFLASIPLLVKLPNAQIYFDVGFVVVLVSLLVQGWTIGFAAHRLHIALPSSAPGPRRVELDLPGQLTQELVGYTLGANNPYLHRHVIPSWAKLMMIVRKQKVYTAEEAGIVREGDHVYLLAPPERAPALDRFFADMPTWSEPEPGTLGDFILPGGSTIADLAAAYGLAVPDEDKALTVTGYFASRLGPEAHRSDTVSLGNVSLVALQVVDGRVTSAGLRLADPDPQVPLLPPAAPGKRLLRKLIGGPKTRKKH